MGGLYGSEYWTYLLPRRVGAATTARLTSAPFRPVGSREAVRIGLLDAALGADLEDFGRPLLASPNGPRMTGCTRHAWRNLQAIDDLVKDVLETDSHLVVSALAGDAGLRRMTYVSTAYVAGDRRGRAHETELDVGQGFRNAYESTSSRPSAGCGVGASGCRSRSCARASSSVSAGRAGPPPSTWSTVRCARSRTEHIRAPGRRDAALDIVTVDHAPTRSSRSRPRRRRPAGHITSLGASGQRRWVTSRVSRRGGLTGGRHDSCRRGSTVP